MRRRSPGPGLGLAPLRPGHQHPRDAVRHRHRRRGADRPDAGASSGNAGRGGSGRRDREPGDTAGAVRERPCRRALFASVRPSTTRADPAPPRRTDGRSTLFRSTGETLRATSTHAMLALDDRCESDWSLRQGEQACLVLTHGEDADTPALDGIDDALERLEHTRGVLAALEQRLHVQRAIPRHRAALGAVPQAADPTPRPARSSRRRHWGCRKRCPETATSTTATPGCGMPRSRSARSSASATRAKPPSTCGSCDTRIRRTDATSS